MQDDDPRVIANRKQQEEIVAAIQKEQDPPRLTRLVEQLLALIDERQTLQCRPAMPIGAVEKKENLDARRKTGT